MRRQSFGAALIVLGVALVLISVFADSLGLGGQPGLGWKQILAIAVGLAAAIAGAALARRRTARHQGMADGDDESAAVTVTAVEDESAELPRAPEPPALEAPPENAARE